MRRPETASTRFIRLSDVEATPWKNDGGVTREIATGVSLDSKVEWGWRFSIANVDQGGPFSLFPGIDRFIAVIDGDGMDLVRDNGSTIALDPFQPVAFSGDDILVGHLRDGPVRDLNVMVQRNDFESTLDIQYGPQVYSVEPLIGGTHIFHTLFGHCAVRTTGSESHNLATSDTLILEGQDVTHVQIHEGSRVAAVRIRQHAQ